MDLGFTGSQIGWTKPQAKAVRTWIARMLDSPADKFRHGDCIGSDTEAHKVVRSVSHARITTHPPTDDRKRSFNEANFEHDPKPFLDRNKDIVDICDHLLATPHAPEQLRSGTWSTIRYAKKCNKPITIIWPDGREEYIPPKPI